MKQPNSPETREPISAIVACFLLAVRRGRALRLERERAKEPASISPIGENGAPEISGGVQSIALTVNNLEPMGSIPLTESQTKGANGAS
ncbi:MAG: hypothetical protein M1570_18590 [Chloroflexi bacterium]|nr:hypothetical protein [Chloroflexota bacterium]